MKQTCTYPECRDHALDLHAGRYFFDLSENASLQLPRVIICRIYAVVRKKSGVWCCAMRLQSTDLSSLCIGRNRVGLRNTNDALGGSHGSTLTQHKAIALKRVTLSLPCILDDAPRMSEL
jgi:hypothetical protein